MRRVIGEGGKKSKEKAVGRGKRERDGRGGKKMAGWWW